MAIFFHSCFPVLSSAQEFKKSHFIVLKEPMLLLKSRALES